VRYQPFDPRVRQVYSGSADGADIPHRFELYPASEAFIAMQDAPNPVGAAPGSTHPSLRLNVDLGNFFEFVPLERINDPDRDAFDASLKQQNVDYTTKRTDGVGMSLPTITPLRPGAFHRWLESKGKLGGQHKCPRCANTRDVLDQVVQFSGDR